MTFLETLHDYKSRGLLMNQVHPTLPLTIWNYTPETQYSGAWDDITLMARGLVTDDKGNIVAKGFPKFFNIEEERHVATDEFEVFEKLDGSLILVFWYEGQMIVASRGSFTSPYAIEAKRLLDEKYENFSILSSAFQDAYKFTYCFELIGFEQIVVHYAQSDIVLTGVFMFSEKHSMWTELPIKYEDELAGHPSIVKKFDGLDWMNIKQFNWKNAEGFVVRFSNGQRCKIKFENYIKLHRQMTNLSTRSIWQALSSGEPVSSILSDVPDEFYHKVHEYEAKLLQEYSDLESDIKVRYGIEKRAYDNLLSIHGYTEHEARKQFAENVAKYPHRGAVFSMLNGKDYSQHIWKQVEPKYERL
jgi:hypothetical protein